MIRVCKICGREFEGRANRDYCSAVCRMEGKRRYQQEYRELNRDKVKQQQHEKYCKRKQGALTIARSDNIALDFDLDPQPKPEAKPTKREPMPDKFKGSQWGRKYYRADRMDKIVMLSSALSKYGIEKLSYGQLSAIFESGRYFTLLKRVLAIKAEERRNYEKQA